MVQYIINRLGQSIVVLLGVTIIVFSFLRLSGDPVMLLVPSDASPELIATTRESLGLDQPLPVQFLRFVSDALRGDFGVSMRRNIPTVQLLQQRLPYTIELTVAALLVSVCVSLPLGITCATYRGRGIDQIAMMASLLGQAMPVFWLGLMLMLVFSVSLGWFPVQGAETPKHLILPAITLGTAIAGRQTRLVRSSMLEVLSQDYVRTARGKGLQENAVLVRHALRNAAIPIVTILGLDFGHLLGGAVVTETIFSWPGVGRLVVEAIFMRDFPVVQTVVLVVSFIFVMINLLVDLSYGFLNPQIRVVRQ